jgi:hypothetical protein
LEELVALAEQIQEAVVVELIVILVLVVMEVQVLLSSHTLAHKYSQAEL